MEITQEDDATRLPRGTREATANSAVCYCLGVTSVDPDRIDMLFEHERREAVTQYTYRKYGAHGAD